MSGKDLISADVCKANRKAGEERVKALEGKVDDNEKDSDRRHTSHEENISDLYKRTERPSYSVMALVSSMTGIIGWLGEKVFGG